MKTKNYIFSIATILLLSACGGSNSDSNSGASDDEIQPTPTPAPTGTKVEVPAELFPEASIAYECETLHEYEGVVDITKVGADGAIAASCPRNEIEFSFAPDINELEVMNIQTLVIGEDYNSKGEGITMRIESDLAKGTINYSGNSTEYGDFDCVITYDFGELPLTIYNVDDVFEFSRLRSNYQVIDDQCPEWVLADVEIDENYVDTETYEEVYTTSIIITDSSGDISNIVKYGSSK